MFFFCWGQCTVQVQTDASRLEDCRLDQINWLRKPRPAFRVVRSCLRKVRRRNPKSFCVEEVTEQKVVCVYAWVHGRGCDCLNLTQLFCLSQVSLFEPWWMDTYRFPKASTRKKVCKTALPSFHVHLSDSPGRIMRIIPWLHCENNAYLKTNTISPVLETWVMRKMIWPTKFY